LNINGPSNGLLLEAGIDPMFSTFKLWFEKTVGHLSPLCLKSLTFYNILEWAQYLHR
jgi:hypothetical protein